MKEASYYQTKEDGSVGCLLCPKGCSIRDGQVGVCRVRRNVGGKLVSENYGQCTSCALDPIEKKPLFHFFPGSKIISLGSYGCNMSCRYCQNWTLSQGEPVANFMDPKEAVALAKGAENEGNIGLAYTYSEPVVWHEYVVAAAKAIKEAGMKNVVVTNGFINPEPLQEWLGLIDAMNIDVKSFSEEFYRRICGAELTPVLKSVEAVAKKCHVEVTTLVVPGLNDEPKEIEALASWLAGINPAIPLHLTRYHPAYKSSAPETPRERLLAAREIASRYLEYVYIGNVPDVDNTTRCPSCGAAVRERCNTQTAQSCTACGKTLKLCGPYLFQEKD